MTTPPAAAVTPAGPIAFCPGDSVVLTANTGTGLSYQWKRDNITLIGATLSTYTAKQTGTYTVFVTSATSCSATSNGVAVSVSSLPVATITPQSSTAICAGQSVTLNANIGTGLTYQWYKDGTAISGAVLPIYAATAAGSYTVKVTNTTNCSTLSSPVNVSMKPQPTVSLGTDKNLAGSKSLTLDAGAGYSSYLWSTSDTTQTILVDGSQYTYGPHSFSVIVTNSVGCANSDTVIITVIDDTGIENADGSASVAVFPNPNDGAFTLKLKGFKGLKVQMTLSDISGRIIFRDEWKIEELYSENQIDAGVLSHGVYFIRLTSEKLCITERIIVR
jgi:hypothetical protein